jgi:inosine-uridine nucleoside N-ribohydrolase
MARGARARHRLEQMRALLVVVLVLLAGCGGAGSGRTPVVVDTDLSTDDVIALMYVLNRPDLDVRAVAVSGTGLARCPLGARHARELLALAGHPGVPVGCGRDDPLEGFDAFAPEWRDQADITFGVRLPSAAGRTGDAVDVLARAADERTVVLSLAPMTDVALLLRKRRVAAVYAMGGAIDVPGNVEGHERAEYNLWIDPAAAQEVLRSSAPVTLVPLDATNQVPVTPYVHEALARAHYATPEATLVYDLMNATGMHTGGQYFWDPLAAAAVGDRVPLRYRTEGLSVVTRGDERGRLTRGDASVRVAVGADRPRFERDLLGALLDGARFSIASGREPPALEFDGRSVTYRGPKASTPGEAAFDTLNTSDRPFTFIVGRLSDGRTASDLRGGAGEFRPPPWFFPELTGETPPHSRISWLKPLTPGEKAIVVTSTDPPESWVVSPLSLR